MMLQILDVRIASNIFENPLFVAPQALSYMHELDFVHLDIKPSNICCVVEPNRCDDFGNSLPLQDLMGSISHQGDTTYRIIDLGLCAPLGAIHDCGDGEYVPP